MPDEIVGKKLYDPSNNQSENKLRQYLKGMWMDKYSY